jgi:hypothetical protein
MVDKELQTLAYRLKDSSTLRNLASKLEFDFEDKPVNKDNWNDDEKKIVQEAKIIASKNDYKIYYIKTNSDSLKEWKSVSTKIIKENNGLCMICSHNPSGFKWIFSSLSKDYSKNFSETRHVPIDIDPGIGVPNTFVEFLENIKVGKNSTATSIASQVSNAFDSFAVQIHDELTVNVFEALKTISEGIIGDENNNLSLDYETLEEIREPIFILLYRIIFILYAEDRGIFPVDNKIYQEEFSLRWIIKDWLLNSTDTRKLGDYEVEKRVKKLFRLIEVGSEELDYKKDEFFMRSYYGRIFDRKINHRLEEWNIPNTNMLEMLSLFTRTNDKKGNYFFLDYSALETRHLGSIYEHLLEYHLEVKNKKIKDLPSSNERKKSGSYYTPEIIVENIVSNSIEPKIEEILQDYNDKSEQIDKILELKILDPSMGSGHFLIGVINYLAIRICQIKTGEIIEEELIENKREVARRCIFGVDVNPLAVDLCKLSVWLETLSSDKPLTFLSAHLKNGNSLIGGNVEEIFNPQTTLVESDKGRSHFKNNVKKFFIFENLDDNSSSSVKTKVENYAKMTSPGTGFYNLNFLLGLKTCQDFGWEVPPIGDFFEKIGENSMDFYTDNSFEKIKNEYEKRRFFHWEIQFPSIFYDQSGKKLKKSGFDIVLGNPPYISLHKGNKDERKYFYDKYNSATKHFDLYVLFVEKSLSLLKNDGRIGFILPTKFFNSDYGQGLREILSKQKHISKIINFKDFQIFKGASTYTCELFLKNKPHKTIDYSEIITNNAFSKNGFNDDNFVYGKIKHPSSDTYWKFLLGEKAEIMNKLESNYELTLSDVASDIFAGFQTGRDKIFFVEIIEDNGELVKVRNIAFNTNHTIEKKILKKTLMGAGIRRWNTNWENNYAVYPYEDSQKITTLIPKDKLAKKFPKTLEYFESFKDELMESETSEAVDNANYYRYRRARSISQFENRKILAQVLAVKNTFVLDDENYYFVGGGNAGGFGIIIDEKYSKFSHTVLAILNSKIAEFYIKNTSSPFQSGFFSYGKRFIKNLPIKLPDEKQNDEIIDLTKKVLTRKENGEDYDEIENKLDDAIFEMYGFDEQEKAVFKK